MNYAVVLNALAVTRYGKALKWFERHARPARKALLLFGKVFFCFLLLFRRAAHQVQYRTKPAPDEYWEAETVWIEQEIAYAND